jgi:hypothetical protein
VAFLIAILTLVLIGLVVVLVGAPLRSARHAAERGSDAQETISQPEAEHAVSVTQARLRDELETEREAKYREIRDTELDYRTGKLSPDDYKTVDADLRAEAIEILDRLEELKPKDA